MGSFFIILSFHYLKLNDFEFLLNIEFENLENNEEQKDALFTLIMAYIIFAIIGFIVQINFFLPEKKKKELNIELDFKN